MRSDPRFPNLHIVDHPLIQHKLTHMRDRTTSTRTFRELLREITLLMGYEITRDLPLTTRAIDTPLASIDAPVIAGKKVAIVPVLRAGLAMAEGLLELIPSARVGHLGMYRGKDLYPVEYYARLPTPEGRLFIVCDPMLATGHTAAHAVQMLLERGVAGDAIRYLALVAAPDGIVAFHQRHRQVPVYVAAVDSHLDAHAYIVPGLGDAGDRIYGTKH